MRYDCSGNGGDGSDGKKLIPAELGVTDPTVTVKEIKSLKSIENS